MEDKQKSYNTGVVLLLVGWSIALLIVGYLLHAIIYHVEAPIIHTDTEQHSISLTRERDNHFRMPVKVNGQEATFMIDTGATMITVSEYFANITKLPPGPKIQVNTASGNVTAHFSKIEKLDIGPWQFSDVSTLVIPNMGTDALLGMNVLKHFNIEQQETSMILRRNQ